MSNLFTIVDNYGVKKTIPAIPGPNGTDAYVQAVQNGLKGGQNLFTQSLAGMDNPYMVVGAVYYTVDKNFSPPEYFGGSWMLIEDSFLLCGDSAYPAATLKTDSGGNKVLQSKDHLGEAKVTLDISQIPSHSHSSSGARFSGSGWYSEYYVYAQNISLKCHPTGGSQPHNNMPPYEVVYAWLRVA